MPLNSAEIAIIEGIVAGLCDRFEPKDADLLEAARAYLRNGFIALILGTNASLDDVRPFDYVDGLQYAIDVIRSWSDTKRMDRIDPIVQSIAADIQGEKLRVESLAI